MLSAAVALLALTGTDPEAVIAWSVSARCADADLAYLSTLSADAAPGLAALEPAVRRCLLERGTGS